MRFKQQKVNAALGQLFDSMLYVRPEENTKAVSTPKRSNANWEASAAMLCTY